ncbi:MAG: ferrochelatase [Saprospiraceae bacterium]|nr:ferrochelatase [Saprospiraceae bacterium]
MSKRRQGILLINLGSPDEPKRRDVDRYLLEFLTDGRVIDLPWLSRQLLVRGLIVPLRAKNSTKLYQQLWTEDGSPLKHFGEKVKQMLCELVDHQYPVEIAMRYQNPSIEDAVNSLMDKRVDEIIVFPLFPQYASATTGSAFQEVMKVFSDRQVIPSLVFIEDYYEHPAMIKVFADHGRAFDLESYDHILFSYHGLPQRQLIKADPCSHCLQSEDCCQKITECNRHCYSAQCYATTQALAKALDLSEERYTTCFQSRLGKDPWAQPYTSVILEERAKAGDKRLLVFSPAFVADCLETIIEVGFEYKEEFLALGGEKIDLVPSLNDDPQWVNAIWQIINERVKISPH